MKFRADEITSVIQREIEQFQSEVTKTEVGRVLEVGDGIARIHGLSGVMTGEMLSFHVGEALIGGVVTPRGEPMDNMGPVTTPHSRLVESPAPGIAERQ